ncbi:hypothetical protein GE21DRAFT_2118 [Neurospora crassa]|uniref:DNA/RNA-binding domain-containing protein n=1 Tax=Neurospora crassa (strain ATCC 24698 / 74-OR23-1A / CBS 708.71 / DSM 1257 / FGSC 987) TaxID=367110 RepID=Q7SI40_NEUCR|nr:hypothetical protein NCU00611 [Neurospora crassa OR74A]EAA36515.3 hypothetical protein NCU00611 [Neurospora crassa OR74A]KHE89855.1 hypothetical protein GE21DRAFT_2118 [Neurospora crassa]|eukprot:XP_965751.3 hypothetical protein NCU00611 [Neurospora crassa OR74A]
MASQKPQVDIGQGFVNYLRKQARSRQKPAVCNLCNLDLPAVTDHVQFEAHIKSVHAQLYNSKTTEKEKEDWLNAQWKASQPTNISERNPGIDVSSRSGKAASPGDANRPSNWGKNAGQESANVAQAQPDRAFRTKSPSPSNKRESSRSQSPPKRSKTSGRQGASALTDDARAEFDRGPTQKGMLWDPQNDTTRTRTQPYDKSNVATSHKLPLAASQAKSRRQSQQSQNAPSRAPAQSEDMSIGFLKQPETRAISQEQLVTEVKGIYAGLVMVESKCIEVDNAQNAETDPANKPINHEQWQALIALHRTLLHEHHDFFLASQHPSASPALRRLAAKYAMPARMWRHGIHSFLELLRHRLPGSLEHMLTFIYLAYSMMALLYETVPAFEETWIECLGDLSRYRMAIEEGNLRDREIWTGVSRDWYSKASDKSPTTGRLYHHLAILSRPNAVQQLYYYAKSLCVAIPFNSARDSIMTLFDPVLGPDSSRHSRLHHIDLAFVQTHGVMFSGKSQDKLEDYMENFLKPLGNHIQVSGYQWREPGYHIAIANCCAIIGWGNEKNPVYRAIKAKASVNNESRDQTMTGIEGAEPDLQLVTALRLANRTHDVVLRQQDDLNVVPYLHATLAFVYHLISLPEAMVHFAPEFPWRLVSYQLNSLLREYSAYDRFESDKFPRLENEEVPRPLPEDFAMRGLLWVEKFFPSDWFSEDKIIDDEKYFESASLFDERIPRVLYLGYRIAMEGEGKWLQYDPKTHRFGVHSQYELESHRGGKDYGELPDAAAHP